MNSFESSWNHWVTNYLENTSCFTSRVFSVKKVVSSIYASYKKCTDASVLYTYIKNIYIIFSNLEFKVRFQITKYYWFCLNF